MTRLGGCLWGVLRACVLLVLVSFGHGTTPALAQTVAQTPGAALQLDPVAMRKLALLAHQSGRNDVALRLTDALLQRDPQDAFALMLRARALRDIGQLSQSHKFAGQAWAAARTGPERHAAALTMAQALSSDGKRTRAQFWLRRAVETAPNAGARARAEQDYRYVKSRNPWSLDFSFSAAPSSNVNNGSRHRHMSLAEFLPDLPGAHLILTDRPVDMTALPGWSVEARIQLRYRLAQTQTSQTDLRFGADWQAVMLSPEAQARVAAYLRDYPTATVNTDFSQGGVDLGLVHRRTFDKTNLSFGLGAAQRLGAGRKLYDALRLDLGLEHRIAARVSVHAAASYEARFGAGSIGPATEIFAAQAGAARWLDSGDILRASIGFRLTGSQAPSQANTALQARLAWQRQKPLLGMAIEMGLGAEHRNHAMASVPRHDLNLSANLSLKLTRIEYMGFSPTVTLRASRTLSNVAGFDGEDIGVALGWRSNF